MQTTATQRTQVSSFPRSTASLSCLASLHMSIALDRIGDSGFRRVIACTRDAPSFQPRPASDDDDDDLDNWRVSSSSATSTTSSIGQNSDDAEDASGRSSDGEGRDDDGEVQSSYKGSLSMMESLQEALPIRRGISGFYDGKSKSFTSLAEAAANSSIKDIAKPENAYSRRRRNLLAINHMWDKNRSLYAKANGGGIYKRPISSSKSTLALAMAMSSSESISSASEDSSPGLPPVCPQTRPSGFHCWRSFSTADLKNSSCFSDGGRLELEKHA